MEEHSIEWLTQRIQELEQQLETQRVELEKNQEEQQSFSNKISHDLHAPLRAIATYIQMISNDYANKPLDEEAQRLFARVQTNANEMKAMLDGLLDFVRVGKKELKPEPLTMTQLVEVICDQFKQQNPQRQFTFQIGKLTDAYADEEMIKKAWMHLISNAVKFTGKKETAVIKISSEEKDGQLIYAIKDNGDGFDMSYSAKLFGVFQRLHHKSDFEGIGIGLSIVNKIVSRHKGRIWAEGKVKEGAAFYFSLPVV